MKTVRPIVAFLSDSFLSARRDDRWWIIAASLGICAALPFALCRYLPLVDLPLHQLEFAIWAEPARFNQYYQQNSYWLPHWLLFLVSLPFVPLLGVEASSRVPLVIYVCALPLSSGLLARAAGRSAWWGLLLLPFAIEFNLAWGFVSYCFAGMLLQLSLALGLASETAERPCLPLLGVAMLGAGIGSTHLQIGAISVATHGFLQVFNLNASYRRRILIVGASATALLHASTWVWFEDQGDYLGSKEPLFAPWNILWSQLGRFSIDVFPHRIEEGLFAVIVGLLALVWLVSRPSLSLSQLRLPLVAALFLGGYFVMPWDLNRQAICQRMPYLALLCLPTLAPPGVFPSRALRWGIVAIAIVGIAQIALAVFAFDRDTAIPLDRLTEETPPWARLVYLGYDLRSPWVNLEVYTHAGAWITLRRGGVYSFNWNRVNFRYRTNVPSKQTFIGREFVLSRQLERTGRIITIRKTELSFWDTILVRWPRGGAAFQPLRPGLQDGEDMIQEGRWGLIRLHRLHSSKSE